MDDDNEREQSKEEHGYHKKGGMRFCCGGLCSRKGRSFWGWVLVFFGAYFIAKDFGLIPAEFSIWPVFLLGIGAWLLIKHRPS